MSSRFLLTVLIFPIILYGQEGEFKWQNPIPQGNNLFDCCCVSDHYCWAVGSAGTIIKSSDQGASWTIQNTGVISELNGVSFADSLSGGVCGNNATVLHTTDGGTTWVEQNVPSFFQTLNDIQFISPEEGWVTGMYGKIFHTIDGGANWYLQNSNNTQNLFSIQFIDSLTGFAAGNNGAFVKTIDGGNSWQPSDFFNEDFIFYSLFFVSPDTGWMCGIFEVFNMNNALIANTTDGGLSWDTITLGYSSLHDIYFTNPQKGYIAAGGSNIFETSNGGESWSASSWGGYHVLESISFFDENLAVSVGYDAQILRRIGGPFYTWRFNDIGTVESLDDIMFINDSEGWAIGDSDSLLLHTEDGGDTWYHFATGLEDIHSPASISFPDSLNGWISGSGGMILHTTDGGYSWNRQSSTTYRSIFSIFFIDEYHGWAVGADDIRLRTTNGGQAWFGFPSGADDYLWGVYFVDQLTGWVVGDDGLINKTTNGGANWVLQNSTSTENLRNVFFLGPLNGWAIGDNSTILHTTDGGSIWVAVPVNAGSSFWDIQFIDEQEGWISGTNGVIIHTTDGGSTWIPQVKVTSNSLTGMYFSDKNSGWFCGHNGTILRYNPDNPVSIENDEYSETLHDKQSVHIYPNPCRSGSEARLTPGNFERVMLYDLRGRIIKELIIEPGNSGDNEIVLNLQDILPGIYLVKAVKRKNSQLAKILIF